MHYRNDNQNINRDGIESSNKQIDQDFYNEPSNYPYMNFPSIMYYPQTTPTYMMEYDSDLYLHQISKVQIHN